MAQHYIVKEDTEKYGKDYMAIVKRLKRTNPSGSLLFSELPHKEYKEHENDRVFVHNRKSGMFEVHFDYVKKEVTQVYLVS